MIDCDSCENVCVTINKIQKKKKNHLKVKQLAELFQMNEAFACNVYIFTFKIITNQCI